MAHCLVNWGTVFQVKPEFSDAATLASCFALQIPFPVLNLQVATRHLCGFSGSKLQLLCLCGKGFIHWSISTQPQVCSVLFFAADSKHIFHNSEVSRTLEDEKQYIEYWGEKSLMRNYKSITIWRKHKFLHKQVAIRYIVWKKIQKRSRSKDCV